MTVAESEYRLQLSQNSFAPGPHTFVADNAGTISHALAISGPGVPTAQTSALPPGGKAQLTVILQDGTYELWCPVDGHKQPGMETHIQVGGGSASPTSSSTATSSGSASAAASSTATSSGGSGGGY
ncbi:hypothetical protein [Kitasatospora kifunensis]|uniref:Blue (type 1) copper domain-containing protein n=1 Tax=Kitasatospora kifunensis TaxID=58351 RepID=A0A7W7VZ99_KITKI|nr:hypothetical protein [Kitasatospora kifunensis]MBB4928557.1 hypothetical protein [Kitasatospora kifunensis]